MADPPVPSAAAVPPPAYLAGLNQAQRRAVEAVDGPVLVLAGAGTGKTRVLTTRLAHILATRRAWPSQILAVTFTNKAAREMHERLERMIGQSAEGLWLGTFHSVAARLLRRHAEVVGLKPNFTILDTDDQLRLVKQISLAEGIDEKRWPARALLSAFERWKDRGLVPDKVPAGDRGELADGRAQALFRLYQDRLATLNAADFGDLLLHNLTIFGSRADILADYQQRFRYILVDEYQDTNVAQYLWLRLLAQTHRNLCCVGDDDQCVAAGTLVSMADGRRRRIEKIKPGDAVLSCYGSGEFRPAEVTHVFHRRRKAGLTRLRTSSGRDLISTAEHIHFADVILGDSPQKHFTYLMHKHGVGYRLGTSQIYTQGQVQAVIGFKQRCIHERADAVWLVRAFEAENDARELEHRLSLAYGITTFPFVQRKGGSKNGLVHDQARLDRLHRDLGSEEKALRLMEDYGLDPARPHHVPQTAPGRRKNLTITLNAERRGKTPMHRIAVSGNDPTDRALIEALGLGVRTYKRNPKNWRFETLFGDFSRIQAIRDLLAQRFDLTVVRKANLLGSALALRAAAQIRPGMMVATVDKQHECVVAVEPVSKPMDVYDINVAGTHNFVANGIVTHNSIYSWRGAEVGNILRFERDFPGAQIVRLEQNYRSTPHILAAASGLIAKNEGRLGKTLWTALNEGERIVLRGLWDGEEEARWVGDEIEARQRQGEGLAAIAILVRAGFQTREFEERFITLGLPYRVVGGPRFYERQEIRDALAYLRLVHQPADDLAFERIVNTPRRGIGDVTLQSLHALSRAERISLLEAGARLVETDELKAGARRALRDFLMALARWRGMAETMLHTELAAQVLDESGYTDMWKADKSPEAPGRLENLKELVTGMAEFDTLAGFLEHVSLVMENAEGDPRDMVNIMTLHSAKGLEFDAVFLPGWEEGLFPSQRTLDENGTAGLEEERRLAYVGLTRARQRAYVSYAANRRLYGQWQPTLPSRFIAELPTDHVDLVADPGLFPRAGALEERGAWSAFAARPDLTRLGPLGRRAPLIEGRPVPMAGREIRRIGGFAPGDRIFHQKFGHGTVRAVEDNKLSISFDKAGDKMVMDAFVEKAAS
jgi:DNA helicase-2/ATP-dependent DNA helicase PcrA